MKYKKLISFLAFFLAVLSVYGQNPFVLKSGEPVTIACGNSEEEVVHTALNLLNRDVESVFSTRIIVTPESKKGMIICLCDAFTSSSRGTINYTHFFHTANHLICLLQSKRFERDSEIPRNSDFNKVQETRLSF